MNNVSELVTKVRSEYGCRLSREQILSYLNSLEKRLCVEILKDTDFFVYTLNKEKQIPIDFHAMDIVSVCLDGKKLSKTTAAKKGYRANGNTIYIDIEDAQGELRIEHFRLPEEYTDLNESEKNLVLSDGHEDVYIYHILSREALLENDVSRLNNYSLLYTQALTSLKQEVENIKTDTDSNENTDANGEGDSDLDTETSLSKEIRFSKIW